jgi:biopolymer transport protein ExbD
MLLSVLAVLAVLGITAIDFTQVLKVNEPDSEIQLLDEDRKVQLSRTTDNKGTITIKTLATIPDCV